MSVTTKNVVAKIVENSQTTQYTAPTGTRALIDKCTATNYSGGPQTLSINLVSSGDTSGNQNLVVKTKTLAAAETYTFPEIVGHTLNAGDFISTLAGAATSISMRVTVREIT
jgi:3-deoxy-D-manno-octulosonic acid (KDO) 8-phosphate synthase